MEDEDDFREIRRRRWVQDYPLKAGSVIEENLAYTKYEAFRDEQKKAGKAPWDPWADLDDWELARWMMDAAVSQTKLDEFLKLGKVRTAHPTLLC